MTVNEEKIIDGVRKLVKGNQILYVIYDRVADEYSEPKMFINSGCALRWFNDLMEKTHFSPNDFELIQVGEMDMDRGFLIANEKPIFVQRGKGSEV